MAHPLHYLGKTCVVNRLPYLLIRAVLEHGDVIANGIFKQEYLLMNHRHVLVEALPVDVIQADAVKVDSPVYSE